MEKEILENVSSDFTYNQKVRIIEGFYSGYYGIIKQIIKLDYIVEITLNEKKVLIKCKKSDLETFKVKKWYSFK